MSFLSLQQMRASFLWLLFTGLFKMSNGAQPMRLPNLSSQVPMTIFINFSMSEFRIPSWIWIGQSCLTETFGRCSWTNCYWAKVIEPLEKARDCQGKMHIYAYPTTSRHLILSFYAKFLHTSLKQPSTPSLAKKKPNENVQNRKLNINPKVILLQAKRSYLMETILLNNRFIQKYI